MKMLYGCPFEKIYFLTRMDTNYGFGRVWETLWKKSNNGTFIQLVMKVFDQKKKSSSMYEVKSAKLAKPKVAILTPWMEFEKKLGSNQIWVKYLCAINVPLLKKKSIMCLSHLQIQNLCQFWSKSVFSQKGTHTAFSFLYPSVLLSC